MEDRRKLGMARAEGRADALKGKETRTVNDKRVRARRGRKDERHWESRSQAVVKKCRNTKAMVLSRGLR
eukprot:2013097-Pleurochrysis_carterae.AAC.1